MPFTSAPDALALSRRVLQALIRLNQLMGVLILTLLIATLIAPEPVMRALGVASTPANAPLILGMRLIMVIGIAGVAVTHMVLRRLLAIVETVRGGDPFAIENATRLQEIAWALLVLEVLHLMVVVVATRVSTPQLPLDIRWNFSGTRWLAVLLLFVLARVFDYGARMRRDLEGTV
jgi:hypothetical protein